MIRHKTILVTGASGFIGGRITEVLHCGRLGKVRAGLSRWGSAARLGRLPVEIVQCNLTDPHQVASALQDVDSVIHCAHGGRTVNVDGTRNLLEASLARGLERFVHVSTAAVYGNAAGDIDEEILPQSTGNEYADTKLEGERLVAEFQQRGLPTSILRPGIVYGPFSQDWTVEPAMRLKSGRWLLPERYASGTCNLIYVDDLAAMVLLALVRPEAVGQVFNANGVDRVTWYDYFTRLNDALGLPSLASGSSLKASTKAALLSPVRRTAKLMLTHFQEPIMRLYQQSRIAHTAMRRVEELIRTTSTSDEFDLYSKDQFLVTEKAKRLLG